MLHIKKPPFLDNVECKSYTFILAFLWCTGLTCGVFFAFAAGDIVSSLMHAAVLNRVSIVGLAAVLIFPLIVSALAVHCSAPALIFPIAFIKALCHGYCLCAIALSFGSAGWLIRFFYTFSDSCMNLFLLWFWIRYLTGNRDSLRRSFLYCVVAAILIGVIDFFLVSPYLVVLMNF